MRMGPDGETTAKGGERFRILLVDPHPLVRERLAEIISREPDLMVCGEAEDWSEAMKVAETIASMSLPSVLAAKEAVNRAFETSQAEGIRFERRIFHSLFATADQGEGMHAFIDKRSPKFQNK